MERFLHRTCACELRAKCRDGQSMRGLEPQAGSDIQHKHHTHLLGKQGGRSPGITPGSIPYINTVIYSIWACPVSVPGKPLGQFPQTRWSKNQHNSQQLNQHSGGNILIPSVNTKESPKLHAQILLPAPCSHSRLCSSCCLRPGGCLPAQLAPLSAAKKTHPSNRRHPPTPEANQMVVPPPSPPPASPLRFSIHSASLALLPKHYPSPRAGPGLCDHKTSDGSSSSGSWMRNLRR
jgi:hypothetical protein